MTIKVYGADWCGDCRRTKAQLEGLGVDFAYLKVDEDDTLRDEAIAISGKQSIPVVVLPDGSYLVEPSNPELAARLTGLGLIDGK